MLTTFEEYCLLPEKQMLSHCSFMDTTEEKTFLSLEMQRHGLIIWEKLNWALFDIYTRFYLSTSQTHTRVMEFIFYNHHIYRNMQMQ